MDEGGATTPTIENPCGICYNVSNDGSTTDIGSNREECLKLIQPTYTPSTSLKVFSNNIENGEYYSAIYLEKSSFNTGDTFSVVINGMSATAFALKGESNSTVVNKLKNAIISVDNGARAEVDDNNYLYVIYPNRYVYQSDLIAKFASVTSSYHVWVPCLDDYTVRVYANNERPSITVNESEPVYITWDSFDTAKSCNCSYINDDGLTKFCGDAVGYGVEAIGDVEKGTEYYMLKTGTKTFNVECSD